MMLSLLQQRVRQFLVHSFLYYQLDESIISDSQYDRFCEELQALLTYSDTANIPYLSLVTQALGTEASGFSIKKYPPPIISVALHLLYQEHYASRMEFTEFIVRFGYRWQWSQDNPEETCLSREGDEHSCAELDLRFVPQTTYGVPFLIEKMTNLPEEVK